MTKMLLVIIYETMNRKKIILNKNVILNKKRNIG